MKGKNVKGKRKLNRPSIKKIVKNTMERNMELKFSDQDTTAQNGGIQLSVTNSGLLVNLGLLTQISVGNQKCCERIGSKIELKSLEMRYDCFIPSSGDSTNNMRVVVLQWLKEAATLTAIQEILFSNSTGGFNWYSPYNPFQAGDFIILHDRQHTLSSEGSRLQAVRKTVKKGYHKSIQFDNLNVVNKGEFFLILIADSGVPIHPTFEGNFRVKYTDA